MSVVNKMINSYQARHDDGDVGAANDVFAHEDEKGLQGLLKRMQDTHVSWKISLSMILSLSILILTSWMLYPVAIEQYQDVPDAGDQGQVVLLQAEPPQSTQPEQSADAAHEAVAEAKHEEKPVAENIRTEVASAAIGAETEPARNVLPKVGATDNKKAVKTAQEIKTPAPQVKVASTKKQSAQVTKPKQVPASETARKTDVAVSNVPKLAPPAAAPSKPEQPAPAVTIEKPKETVATISKTPLEPTNEEKAERSYQRAVTFLTQGRIAESEFRLRQAIDDFPAHTGAREMLAGLLIKSERWQDVEKLLHDGIAIRPQNAKYRQWLGRIFLQQNRSIEAIKVLDQGKAFAANNADYFGMLALANQNIGNRVEAVDAYKRALELQPAQARWMLGIGTLYEAEEQWEAARDAYQRAMAIGTLDPALNEYLKERLEYVKLNMPSFARQ